MTPPLHHTRASIKQFLYQIDDLLVEHMMYKVNRYDDNEIVV